MLLGEQGGRDEHRNLLAGRRGDERGAQRDFGLAETDIAADDAIHRPRGREVGDDGVDRGGLVGGLLERKCGGELLVHLAIDRDRRALARFALRIDREQLGGDVADLFGGLLLRALPGIAAECMQRREFGRGSRIARNQMQLGDRHVELVAFRVFDREEFGIRAADVELEQALVTAHAMVDMHDR